MPPLTLRPATQADRDVVLTWANDPATRAMSFDPEPISPSEHAAWFAERLADPDSRLFIAQRSDQPIGLVRFVRAGDGRWELGVNLAPAARGRGLGAEVIAMAVGALRAELGPVAVWARTRPDNRAFAAAAARAGWTEQGPTTCRGQAAAGWTCTAAPKAPGKTP